MSEQLSLFEGEVENKPAERVMTIARGLTRKKTIIAQLQKISSEVGTYGAWSNKEKHPYGDNKANVDKSHDQAQEKINSLYQQYNDLVEEYIKINLAIARTNEITKITIGNREMTIAQALMYKDAKKGIAKYMNDFVKSYKTAVQSAQNRVDMHNNRYASALENLDEKAKNALVAQVSYLVPKEKVEELDQFLVEFVNEIDGELNAINAITPLIWG
jgi:IS1 family transposase